jgi:hypothetical protein
MQRRAFLALAALGATATLTACGGVSNPMAFVNDPLIGDLTKGIAGLSETQAAGGVGSMLGLAKNSLSPSDFGSISKLMPNADSYLRAASDAGISTGDIRSVDGLNQAFAKLGMNPNQARSLLGSVTDFIGKEGGSATRGLMTKALGM